jgi:hypothetical protein
MLHLYRNKNFYSYDNEPYDNSFPIVWAESHMKGTGPSDCTCCQKYGSWNGVFVDYCLNCAQIYNGERGKGVNDYLFHYKSIEELSNIGDTEIMDSAKCFQDDIIYLENNNDFGSFQKSELDADIFDFYTNSSYIESKYHLPAKLLE